MNLTFPFQDCPRCLVIGVSFLEEEAILRFTEFPLPVLSVRMQGWVTEGRFSGYGSLRRETEVATPPSRRGGPIPAGPPWGGAEVIWASLREWYLLPASLRLRMARICQQGSRAHFCDLFKNR